MYPSFSESVRCVPRLSAWIPVSPNTIYAYLQVIILGLRGLRIEANAREIQNDLAALGGDLAKVSEHMATVGRHLGNSQKQYEEAMRDFARFEAKLESIGRKGVEGATRSMLPEAEE